MRTPTILTTALGVLVALLALYVSRFGTIRLPSLLSRGSFRATPAVSSAVPALQSSRTMATSNSNSTSGAGAGTNPGQVYFLSHGGPPTMFDTASAPYKAWIKYGATVTANNPRGLIVVSAHWENPHNSAGVVVNEDASNPLVYDFYGFPAEYYQQTFVSRGDAAMLSAVKAALQEGGVEVGTAKRGLDHGVWVPFKVAFNGRTDIPIVQVSLPGDSSPISAAKLGRALAPLRAQGYGIMGTGQAVHNLRDYMMGRNGSYGKVFLDAVSSAVRSKDVLNDTVNLFRHPAYRSAHPTPEHLLPLVVAAAAVDPQTDKLNTLFVEPNGALGWGMWMWKAPEGAGADTEGAAPVEAKA